MTQDRKQEMFGEWLRKRRWELDLTQQELARRAGCSRISLRRIESGSLKPSKKLAETLLKLLGIPDPELTAWVGFARGLASPPPLIQVPPRTNLPSQLTSFIGREKEISEIKDALSKYRLVTLTGSGGVGKSRLSLQVAAGLLNDFPDGIWFIELSHLSDPALIPQTIQNTLGLIEQDNLSATQAIQEYLQEKKMLLILDNCEHVIESSAALAHDLLRHTTYLKILASSRETLNVQGEFFYRVPSLALPDMGNIPEVEQLSQYESVRLFIERAQLINSKFELNKGNGAAIVQICFRLDGIPLAIELAAAKLRTLSVEQIQARLDDRFNLLANNMRATPPRHQTLQATIDWSYNLLSEKEKTLFRNLAVFPSAWTLEAAELICSGNGIEKEHIMDLIASLVQKSLINAEQLPAGIRYRWLETIREYAIEKINAGEETEIIQRQHLRYYVELAERAEPELRGSNQVIWFRRLELEISNLRSALKWSQEKDQESFLRLSSSLWLFFRSFEYCSEGIEWLSGAVDANKCKPTKLLSTAAAKLSYLSLYPVSQAKAETYANLALELSRQVGDPSAETLALISIAEIELDHLEIKQGPEYAEQALKIARSLQDHWLVALALLQKGKFDQLKNPLAGLTTFEDALREAQLSGSKRTISSILFWIILNLLGTGKFARAREVAEQRIAVATEIGDKDAIIYSHNALGSIALFEDDYSSSLEHAETVIRLAKLYSHDSGLLGGLGTAGLVHLALKDFSRALDLANEMEKSIHSSGRYSRADIGYHLFLRVWVYILKGGFEGVRKNARELFKTYRQDRNTLILIECFRVFASLALLSNAHEQYAILIGVANKLHGKFVVSFLDFPFMVRIQAEQSAVSCKVLGEDAFKRALETGQAMTLEESMELARKLTSE